MSPSGIVQQNGSADRPELGVRSVEADRDHPVALGETGDTCRPRPDDRAGALVADDVRRRGPSRRRRG